MPKLNQENSMTDEMCRVARNLETEGMAVQDAAKIAKCAGKRLATSFMIRENDIMLLNNINNSINKLTQTNKITKSTTLRAIIKYAEKAKPEKLLEIIRKQI